MVEPGADWRSPSDRRTLGDVIEQCAADFGDRTAYVVDGTPVTFRESEHRSATVAAALHRHGVRHGDRVALLVENCVDLVDVFFACGRMGAIEVAINTANRGDFLRHQLENSDPTVLVVDDHYLDRIPVDAVLPSLRAVLVRTTGLGATAAPDLAVPTLPVRSLYEEPGELPEPSSPVRFSDPLSIVYTSGTSGPSKGVVISHHYMISAASVTFLNRGGAPGDVVYSPLPLYHLNAHIITLLGPYMHGGTGVLDRHFSVSRFWDRVDEVGANHLAILGAQLHLVWNLPPDPRDGQRNLKVLVGAPIPPEMRPKWEQRYGLKTSQGFALSEACPITSSPAGADTPPGSSGQPVATVEVRLLDDDDVEVPEGEVGEICVRPREPFIIFSGYWRNPEATAAAWRNGWFHTGDLGRFDERRFLTFVDRKKDYLRRRGENVSSFEVERALLAHPAVGEAAAVGVPSELSEDDCLVLVAPRPGVTLDPWDLVHHCVENMPFFAVPRYFAIMDELPKTPTGKVEKYRLRSAGVPDGAFDLEAAGYRVNRSGLVRVDELGRTAP